MIIDNNGEQSYLHAILIVWILASIIDIDTLKCDGIFFFTVIYMRFFFIYPANPLLNTLMYTTQIH